MGIPGLYRDVSSYAETVLLGSDNHLGESADHISNVVIDGPSLVYHVYNKLLAANEPASLVMLPAYISINIAVLQYLSDLRSCNVNIVSIFFDGALPIAKRETRLQRLEKTRQQLENYRRLNLSLPKLRTTGSELHASSFLWAVNSSPMHSQLPPPPFMVASVIETLFASSWANITYTVPGEADVFCGIQACHDGVSVLSNDFDILLFNLHASQGLVSLNNMQLLQVANGASLLQSQCFKPSSIARQLNVTSMFEYAVQKLLDNYAGPSIIAQRAKTAYTNTCKHSEEIQFRQQHATQIVRAERLMHHREDQLGLLNGLDPRTAELVSSLNDDEELHVYLSILFEDPSRDSSWSYGADIRRLAYSILINFKCPDNHDPNHRVVIEHARRGNRIAETNVSILDDRYTLQSIDDFHTMYSHHLSCTTNDKPTTVFEYHRTAARIVAAQRNVIGKSSTVEMTDILYPCISQPTTWTWNHMHLLANIDAVLYSLRMLRQLVGHVLRTSAPNLTGVMSSKLKQLESSLCTMPPIADLFLNLDQLRQTLLSQSYPIQESGLVDLYRRGQDGIAQAESRMETSEAETKTKRKKRRKPSKLKSDVRSTDTRADAEQTEKQRQNAKSTGGSSVRSTNPFAVLSE